MNRAFISLYLIVVLFIAFMGWGLDKLWQQLSPPPSASSAELELITLAEHKLVAGQAMPEHQHTKLSIFSPDDFANSSLSDELSSGQALVLHNQHGETQIYKHSEHTPHIIRLTLPQTPSTPSKSYVYEILLSVFYGSIALAIFIWVWPLMRDVRKLEKQTQHVGRNTFPEAVNVMPGSAVGNLAQAFNKMAERIKELLASHKEMTYAVSHELRTPLARMKFALAMLQDGTADQPCSPAHLNSLRQDIEEMDALITQLLTYAGYEQESGPLVQEKGDMAFLVSELIQRAKDSHQDKDIQILLECEANATQMTCNWHLMERAIFNLINNAMRFAEQKILVSLNATDTDFVILVSDDGPGIPTSERSRVFESFVRLNSTINAKVRGFGLGLAIVRRVMKWHEGEARVSSSASGGALFTLRWPN